MRNFFNLRVPFIVLIATLVLSISSEIPARADGGTPLNFVFTKDTSEDYIEEVYEGLNGHISPLFILDDHWGPAVTASTDDGPSSVQGESVTLTWSIIPDGTWMPKQFIEDTGCFSSLNSDLNSKYGTGNWQAEIIRVFDDWASKTGNRYVYEPNDDGATWPGTPGDLGKRGDIRIGGCTIDGNSGILGFNFYPNGGDMKIDSKDSFYATGTLTPRFHNVFSHEHGHGVGIKHVCPINTTKLMEPIVTTAFTGLQHDDIRAAQRHYGDRNELVGGNGNDTATQATNLGNPIDDTPIITQTLSIDDNSDQDWYKFTINAGKKIDVTVTPVGSTYLSGPQNSNGSCTAGTPTNSLAVHNLDFKIIDSDTTTVLATGNTTPGGMAETVTDVLLSNPGVKYIHVTGDGTDGIQLYNLEVTVKSAVDVSITKTTSPDPAVTGQPLAYTLTVTGTGDITATNILITDTVPTSTTLDTNSLNGAVITSGTSPGSIITWTTGLSLTLNQSLTRTFVVTIDNGLANGSTIVNTGHVSASNLPVVRNHTLSTMVTAPVLTSTISSNPGVIQATTTMITYTITLHNIGDAAATGVTITNTIPGSTTYVTGSASDGGIENNRVITWTGAAVNANSSIIRTFKVTVSATITDGDQLVNTLSANSAQGAQIQDTFYPQTVGLKLAFLPIILKNN